MVEATPGHRRRWLGRWGIPGVFDAEHSFTITARVEGGVRLSQNERFTGVLVPLMVRSLDRHTQPCGARKLNAVSDVRVCAPLPSRRLSGCGIMSRS